MGASLSVSDHFTHREGSHHSLKHVAHNEKREPCGMCTQPVELGEPVRRSRSCAFVLHDGCYRRPNKIAHFAHSCSGRPLTLTGGDHSGHRRRSCNICAVAFDDDAFVYGCNKCGGFYAHPRCCGLPQTVHNHELHPNHPLTLLPPPANGGEHRRRGGGRRCINRAGGCGNAKRLDSAAWSYQCNNCGVELCLACQLPGGDGGARRHGGGGGHHHLHVDLETMVPVAERVASAVGTILHGFCCTLCLGAPGAPPAMPQPATNK